MAFIETTATRKLLALDKRIRGVAGGTSAGKTISILQILIDYALSTEGELISVVSESFPHLRRGAMRDFINIMQEHGYFDAAGEWSKTDYTFTFHTGSKIEFFSADQPGKVRGPRRDVLFANELNNIPKETWEQLLIRTRKIAWADWNPLSDFFFYEDYVADEDKMLTTIPEADFIILTYKDNEALEPAIIQEIERRKINKQWYRVFGQGKRGDVEGKIFSGWKIIDEIPHEARLEVRGGDFGFARDRTAFCDIYYYNGGYIIDEIVSRVGLKDTDLANILLNQPNPNTLSIVDSADSQKVLTLNEMGVNATGVIKRGSSGKNFTNAAISFVQDQKISVTKRSVNYIRSYRNFMWQTDKDGNVMPQYDHFSSDEMMSVVYGFTHFSPKHGEEEQVHTSGNFSSSWA